MSFTFTVNAEFDNELKNAGSDIYKDYERAVIEMVSVVILTRRLKSYADE